MSYTFQGVGEVGHLYVCVYTNIYEIHKLNMTSIELSCFGRLASVWFC